MFRALRRARTAAVIAGCVGLAAVVAGALWVAFSGGGHGGDRGRQVVGDGLAVGLTYREGTSEYADLYAGAANLLAEGDYAGAEQVYRRLILLESGQTNAHVGLGTALVFRKQLPAAEKAYRKALEIDGGCVSALVGLGSVLMRLDRPAEARAHYARAVEADGTNADAHYGLGTALEALGVLDEAAAHYDRCLAIDADYPLSREATKALRSLRPGR